MIRAHHNCVSRKSNHLAALIICFSKGHNILGSPVTTKEKVDLGSQLIPFPGHTILWDSPVQIREERILMIFLMVIIVKNFLLEAQQPTSFICFPSTNYISISRGIF